MSNKPIAAPVSIDLETAFEVVCKQGTQMQRLKTLLNVIHQQAIKVTTDNPTDHTASMLEDVAFLATELIHEYDMENSAVVHEWQEKNKPKADAPVSEAAGDSHA